MNDNNTLLNMHTERILDLSNKYDNIKSEIDIIKESTVNKYNIFIRAARNFPIISFDSCICDILLNFNIIKSFKLYSSSITIRCYNGMLYYDNSNYNINVRCYYTTKDRKLQLYFAGMPRDLFDLHLNLIIYEGSNPDISYDPDFNVDDHQECIMLR